MRAHKHKPGHGQIRTVQVRTLVWPVDGLDSFEEVIYFGDATLPFDQDTRETRGAAAGSLVVHLFNHSSQDVAQDPNLLNHGEISTY